MRIEINRFAQRLSELRESIAKSEKRTIAIIILLSILVGFIFLFVFNILPSDPQSAAGTGYYINIAGCGENPSGITDFSCAVAVDCNPSAENCTAPAGGSIVVHECNGKVTDCRERQLGYNMTGTVSLSSYAPSGSNPEECQKTVQIDVFNQKCRPDGDPHGGWLCGEGSLTDYITYYWEGCEETTPTPGTSVTPTVSPTPGICDISTMAIFFQVECGGGACNWSSATPAPPGGIQPVEGNWYSPNDVQYLINGGEAPSISGVRCVMDYTKRPMEDFTEGYVEIVSPGGAVVASYPVSSSVNWSEVSSQYGIGEYTFRCVYTGT